MSSSKSTAPTEEWEVDAEDLVHVEVAGIFQDNNTLTPESTKFVGLDSERPIVQLGAKVFAGQYLDTIGTSVFFKKDPQEQEPSDSVFDKQVTEKLQYGYKTNKKLVLKRVFLKEKEPSSAESDPKWIWN